MTDRIGATQPPQRKLVIPPADAVERIRLGSERQQLEQLLADPATRRHAEAILERSELATSRRRLLAAGLRITERIIPSLVRTVSTAQQITHYQDREVEIFVHDDHQQNACCMDFGDGRLFLVFSARLLERMAPRELLFVIGHELGHAAYGHNALPSSAMLQETEHVSPGQAMKLMSWSRRAEISCDRVGLLCCQDLRSATLALIKISCGLKEPLLQFNIEDYISQMKEIQNLSESVEDAADWFSSHPFNPLRVVALHDFWASQPLAHLLGHAGPTLSAEEMEAKIDGLLRSMEPDTIEAKEAAARESLLWGGYWVAAVNGRIEPSECESIRSLTDAEAVSRAETEIRESGAPLELITKRFHQSARRCLKLPPPDRHALMQKLIVVARADGQLSEEERGVLREICRAFDVNPNFVDQILLMTG